MEKNISQIKINNIDKDNTKTKGISKTHKLAIGAISALAFAIVVSGSALVYAQSADSNTNFLDRVAQISGVDSLKLQNAFKQASNEKVDKAVVDGKLTEDQAKNIKEKIANDDFRGPNFGERGMPGKRGFDMKENLADISTFLGLNESDLRKSLHDGKTLVSIAVEKGKSESELKTFLSAKVDERIQKALDSKKITEVQAIKLKENKDQMISDLINGKRPEFKGFPGIRSMDDKL